MRIGKADIADAHRAGLRAPAPLLALLALMVAQSPLEARDITPASPGPVWQIESDDDYNDDADYRPPPLVRGLALHGYHAGEDFQVDPDGRLRIETDEKCGGSVTIADPRGLPESFPARTQTEFWFYRSGDQGVYLRRHWNFEVSDRCEASARVEATVVHVSLFNGRARFIEIEQDGDTKVSSAPLGVGALYPIPGELIDVDDRSLREHAKGDARRRKDDRFGKERLARACFDNSFSFFFSTSCFLTEPGRWYGLLVSAESQDDTGDAYSEYGLVELDPKARIDGRLFEWDREIRLSAAAKAMAAASPAG